MKTTNRLIGLFAAILATATLMAEVVYEPLIVDSGFNRDVIAETTPLNTQVTKSYLLSDTNTCYWSMATQSVIRTLNIAYNDNPKNTNKFTAAEIESTAASGWPDDHDTIRCIEDARGTYGDDLFWIMAPYDQKNVLTIRPKGGKTQAADSLPDGTSPGIQKGEGSLKFKKVGCYDRVYILMAAAKEKGLSTGRQVSTIVHYTDGDTTKAIFTYGGLSGQKDHNVRRTNIYEGRYAKNTHIDTNNAYIMAFDMPVSPNKLISKIEFKNTLVGTGVMIFAVTGRTADVKIPDEEKATVSDIDTTSFQACWDAIEDATYRLDVAEDIDFQHILARFNNKEIDEGTCAEVDSLLSNHDYYWRVRAVNSEGGQSASSAPHRVKTIPDPTKEGYTPPYTDEEYTSIEEMLGLYIGTKAPLAEIDIHRTLYRDGAFNTLCLPFDLDAEQIDKSPLKGVQVYEFVHAEKNPVSNHLEREISGPIDHITAGVPYLVKWAPTTPEVIDGGILVFKNVNVVTNHGQTLGEGDDVKFVGNIGIAHLVEEEQLGLDHNKLFLGAENTLYWPQDNTNLKGFRAYFLVPDGPSGAPKNTPARIIERHETATGMEQMTNDKLPITQKIIRDNQLYILHNGTMYNVQGQEVKR